MRRTHLRNKFIDSDASRRAHNKQRNYCVSYFSNLKIRDVTDDKILRRKMKTLFSEKINLQTKITLVEKEGMSNENV